MVTAVTSNVWGVTRGAEGTTPVTHATGFTIQQVVSAGELNNFQQMRNGGNTVTSTITTIGTVGSYTPAVTDVPAAGVVYDFTAFGQIHDTTHTATLATVWNGTTLASAISGTEGLLGTNLPLGSSWWLEGKVHCFGATTMVSGFNFQASNFTTGTQTVSTIVGANSAPVTVSGTGPLNIIADSSAWTLITAGVLIHRIS